jgi:hypothetical protein
LLAANGPRQETATVEWLYNDLDLQRGAQVPLNTNLIASMMTMRREL